MLHEELAQVDAPRLHHRAPQRQARQGDREDRRARRARARTSASPTRATRANQGAQFVRHLENMLVLARVIAQGARNRDESRGAHFKPAFPKRDDAELAAHDAGAATRRRRAQRRSTSASSTTRCAGKRVHVTDAVDISLVKPRARKYEQAGAASAAATGKLRPRDERDAMRRSRERATMADEDRPPQDPAAGRPDQPRRGAGRSSRSPGSRR